MGGSNTSTCRKDAQMPCRRSIMMIADNLALQAKIIRDVEASIVEH